MAIAVEGKQFDVSDIARGLKSDGEVVVDGYRFFRDGRRIACEKVEDNEPDEELE